MEIIPVIDIKGGVVVRAVAGNRSLYRPLHTPLAQGYKPEDIARGFYSLFPFNTLYIADLDRIEGGSSDVELHRRILEAWQGKTLWIDEGTFESTFQHSRILSVTGSETLLKTGTCFFDKNQDSLWCSGILSLDFRGDTFLGPHSLLEKTSLWPDRIIVMSLERVGCEAGPDLQKIEWIKNLAGYHRKIYAAGGIRNSSDLWDLKKRGISGALLASAFHNQQIKFGDLEKIAE